MRNLLKLSILFCVPLLAGVGCDKQDLPECVKGNVIGYQSCYNVNVIQIESGSLTGNEIVWNNEEYDNVVQSPGGLFTDSIIYFNYRIFDPEKDEVYGWDYCPAIYAPLTVPTIVITNYSTSNCPVNHEN